MTRTAVVTGGGTGIGRATAAALAAAGLDVVITGRRKAVLDETAAALGANVRAVAFDATDPAGIEAALPDLPARVDVLVNNAGGNTDRTRPAPTTLAEVRDAWQANLDVNLISAVLVTAALTPRLADDARVVTVGSIAGSRGNGSYGAAKAALVPWNAAVAQELGGRGVTANVVSPGYVEDTEFFGEGIPEDRRRWNVEQTANGRPGRPEEVAALIAFLASPEAGNITAQVVHTNGGAHLGH